MTNYNVLSNNEVYLIFIFALIAILDIFTKMKPLYQQVLYQLQSSIEEHIYANYEFLNGLTKYQENTTCSVVSKEEIKSIENEKSDTAKIRCLLQILKPKENKHYEAFKQALDITKNGHVLAVINKSEKQLEPGND